MRIGKRIWDLLISGFRGQQAFADHLENRLSECLGEQTRILRTSEVAGGSNNRCRLLETTGGRFFLKSDSAHFGPDRHKSEFRGLETLADIGVIRVPTPYICGTFLEQTFLLMEWLEKGESGPNFWAALGVSLSLLHRRSRASFGLEYDNYITRERLVNGDFDRWSDFYVEKRIRPLAIKAFERGLLVHSELEMAESICARMYRLVPVEPPALLHGDLWIGNTMPMHDGRPAVYDPVICYGHREMDIAWSLLSGGFDGLFYDTYNEAYPMVSGWRDRAGIFQIYPLLAALLSRSQKRASLIETLKKYA
jgi:protein-ribulosamine 3-kinase